MHFWLHFISFLGILLVFTSNDLFAQDRLTIKEGGKQLILERAHHLEFKKGTKKPEIINRDSKQRQSLKEIDSSIAGKKGEIEPVFYIVGKKKNAANQRILERILIVEPKEEADLKALKKDIGASRIEHLSYTKKYVLFHFNQFTKTLDALNYLRTHPSIKSAEPSLRKIQTKRYQPNDPLFSYSFSSAGYQWHLQNTGQNSSVVDLDIEVSSVWDNYRGSGITIGIVDDGLQVAHPDLSPNIDSINDQDWNDSTINDPTPDLNEDHGTACAGLVAAQDNNSFGGTGVAPDAKLAGLRILGGPISDTIEAQALSWKSQAIDIYSNSWGPADFGDSFGGIGPLAKAAIEDTVINGRNGKGCIYTWAGGNGADLLDNSNLDAYANLKETIAVGAITSEGYKSYFSERGSNLVLSAPSSGGLQGITTTSTSNFGNFTNLFGGTSAATPIVSGVCALMLEANPNLGWRDVQEILMQTARQIDPLDREWILNGAGFHFNHKYGAGMVNAHRAVEVAKTWQNLSTSNSISTNFTTNNNLIPDNSADGISFEIDTSNLANLRVEHVELEVNIDHLEPGQLDITLISPAGTVSNLMEANNQIIATNINWTFMTVRNWGESSQGTWRVFIRDRFTSAIGDVNGLTLKVHGAAFPGATGAPVIANQSSYISLNNQPMQWSIRASNTPSSYSSANLPNGFSLSPKGNLLHLPRQNGTYTFDVQASNNEGSSLKQIQVEIVSPDINDMSRAQAIDTDQQIYSPSRSKWNVQSSIKLSGANALSASSIGDSNDAVLEMQVDGPGVISFSYRCSSELDFDFFHFMIDGTTLVSVSGEIPWTNAIFNVPAGNHVLRWQYVKDSSVSDGSDAAYLDAVGYLGGNSYSLWKADKFSISQQAQPSISGMDADPDNDGITNANEFLHDLDPLNKDTLPSPAVYFDQAIIAIQSTRPQRTGVRTFFEFTSDFINWEPHFSTSTPSNLLQETISANFPDNQLRHFARSVSFINP